jgi:hypothetical protein
MIKIKIKIIIIITIIIITIITIIIIRRRRSLPLSELGVFLLRLHLENSSNLVERHVVVHSVRDHLVPRKHDVEHLPEHRRLVHVPRADLQE